jgi:hypothetical protein
MTATCTNCSTQFVGVDRSEDGEPEVPEARKCAEPTCEVFLCAGACQELSFSCDCCGQRFCESHGLTFRAGRFCIACAADVPGGARAMELCAQPAAELLCTLASAGLTFDEIRAYRAIVERETGRAGEGRVA